MSDDADANIHDTLPLVRDAQTGALRFARLGEDDPSSFVTVVEDLPDAEMTLRIFAHISTLQAWVDGARVFATDNAVAFISPDLAEHTPILLVVRYDQPRAEGASLNEVITLANPPDDHVARELLAGMGQRRERAAAELTDRREEQMWLDAWKAELAVIKAGKHELSSHFARERKPGIGVEFVEDGKESIRGMGKRMRLDRQEEALALSISWRPQYRLDEDLKAIRDKAFEDCRIISIGDRRVRRVETFDAAAIDDFSRALDELVKIEQSLEDRQNARNHVRGVRANQRIMKTLRLVQGGCFIMRTRRGVPGSMLSLNSLTAQSVPHSLINDMATLGLLTCLWTGELPPKTPNDGAFKRRRPEQFLGLSDYGVAILGSDDEIAYRMAASVHAERSSYPKLLWNESEPSDPHETFPKALAHLGDGDREATIGKLEKGVPENPTEMYENWASDTDSAWGKIALGIGLGVLRLNPADGRLERLETSPAAAPRR